MSFQRLSTPHGALGTIFGQTQEKTPARTFQLHTVHQEHAASKSTLATTSQLSTPHGALGTVRVYRLANECYPFNSTRCIRNPKGFHPPSLQKSPLSFQLHTVHQEPKRLSSSITIEVSSELSTPHGALGTQGQLGRLDCPDALSTPHGALGTLSFEGLDAFDKQLSTPHGALGTKPFT